MDYLCTKSSRTIRNNLICHAIYAFRDKIRGSILKEQECRTVTHIVADLLFWTDWKEAFHRIPGLFRSEFKNQTTICEKLENGYLYIGADEYIENFNSNDKLIFVRKAEHYKAEVQVLGFLKEPNTWGIEKHLARMSYTIASKKAHRKYEEYKDEIHALMDKIYESFVATSDSSIKPIPVSEQEELVFIPQHKTIWLLDKSCDDKRCIASIKLHYEDRRIPLSKLSSSDFFEPEQKFKLFLDTHSENQEIVNKIFSNWLNGFGIKIPFSLGSYEYLLIPNRISKNKKLKRIGFTSSRYSDPIEEESNDTRKEFLKSFPYVRRLH